jgi:hypothetical protein
MATMITEVYDALKEAGASEEKARSAAEVLASYDARFVDLKTAISDARSDFRAEIGDVKAELRVLKYTTASTAAMIVAILLRVFLH